MTRRTIIIILAISSLSILMLGVFLSSRESTDSTLVVLSAPDSLEMKCDTRSKNIVSKQPIAIRSGSHTCTFAARDFESHTVTFTVTTGQEHRLVFMLQPQNDSAKAELNKAKYDEIRDGVGSHKVVEGGKKIEDTNPIVKQLPYYSRWFSITPCSGHRSGKDKVGICITTTDKKSESQVDTALKRLKQLDENYETYDLTINGYPIPSKQELEAKVAIPCGKGYPSWCYRFIRH